jgi:hypothetical protein
MFSRMPGAFGASRLTDHCGCFFKLRLFKQVFIDDKIGFKSGTKQLSKQFKWSERI